MSEILCKHCRNGIPKQKLCYKGGWETCHGDLFEPLPSEREKELERMFTSSESKFDPLKTKAFALKIQATLYQLLEDDPCEFLGDLDTLAGDLERIRKVLAREGINAGHALCYGLWKRYSMQSSAKWLSISDNEIRNEAYNLIGKEVNT